MKFNSHLENLATACGLTGRFIAEQKNHTTLDVGIHAMHPGFKLKCVEYKPETFLGVKVCLEHDDA